MSSRKCKTCEGRGHRKDFTRCPDCKEHPGRSRPWVGKQVNRPKRYLGLYTELEAEV